MGDTYQKLFNITPFTTAESAPSASATTASSIKLPEISAASSSITETKKCDNGGFKFSDPAWRLFLVMCFLVIVFFVLFSPGLVVSIPTNSQSYCASKIPLPGGATGNCNGSTYYVGTSDPVTPTLANPICQQRNNCGNFFGSGYTNFLTSFIHAIIFVIVINIISSYLLKE